MREILFRGKRIDNGEWVEGFYSQYESKFGITDFIVVVKKETKRKVQKFLVDKKTIYQYTGLKDIKGNKVFENDIVNVFNKPYESKEPVVVVWGKKSYGWSLKFNCGDHYEHKPLIKYYSLPSSKNIEIIGNIHDTNDKN